MKPATFDATLHPLLYGELRALTSHAAISRDETAALWAKIDARGRTREAANLSKRYGSGTIGG